MTAHYAFSQSLPINDFTNSYRLYSHAELRKEASADDVANAALLYREYRRLYRIARDMGFTTSASRYASLMGVALRAMRRAASAHNGMGV